MKDKIKKNQVCEAIYRSIFKIAEDHTGNASYRKYFDKVLKDIFGIEGIVTTILMSGNQFKCIRKFMDDPEYQQFCQMMLREKDVSMIHDLVRVAYDAAQIANKPKKAISNKDIKSYRYLCKIYAQGIKTMRKKYKSTDSKKSYKSKYRDLDRKLKRNDTPYQFDLTSDNDDVEFDDLFSEDEDEDNEFEDGFDFSDLPINKVGKSIDTIDEDEFEDSDEDIMPQAQFQRYAMSIFERLLKHMEPEEDTKFVIPESSEEAYHMGISSENDPSDNIEKPIKESQKDTDFVKKDYNDMSREEIINEFNSSNSGTKEVSEFDKEDPKVPENENEIVTIIPGTPIEQIPKNTIFNLCDKLYYSDEDAKIHPVNKETKEIDHNTTIMNFPIASYSTDGSTLVSTTVCDKESK